MTGLPCLRTSGPDHPDLLAGKDLSARGTWLGITKQGRIAAVTNSYLITTQESDQKLSRGNLVMDYLTGNIGPEGYLEQIRQQRTKLQRLQPVNRFKRQSSSLQQYFWTKSASFKQAAMPSATLRSIHHGQSHHSPKRQWPNWLLHPSWTKRPSSASWRTGLPRRMINCRICAAVADFARAVSANFIRTELRHSLHDTDPHRPFRSGDFRGKMLPARWNQQ